jgi:hypothetical protein
MGGRPGDGKAPPEVGLREAGGSHVAVRVGGSASAKAGRLACGVSGGKVGA